jgi:hypothetical protein
MAHGVEKRKFKAKIVEDFKGSWLKAQAEDENITIEQCIEYYDGVDLDNLSKRISGQVATLVRCKYNYGTVDYFELLDNNHVIHPILFRKIN